MRVGRALVWSFENEVVVGIIGLLLAQCAVVSVVAMCSNMPVIVRYVLPASATLGCLFVLTKVLPLGVGGDGLAKFALFMSGHTLTTMVGMLLYRQVQEYETLRLRFSVGTLLTWTTLAAVGISLGNFFYRTWELTPKAFTSSDALTISLLGVYCGVQSIVWVHVLWTCERTIRALRLVIASLTTMFGSYALAHVVNALGIGSVFIEPMQLTTITLVLGVILTLSMIAMLVRFEA